MMWCDLQVAAHRGACFAAALAAMCWFAGSPVAAQQSQTVPAGDYVAAFQPYLEGEYATALRAFQEVARGGIRTVDGRWIDSICYFAMVGECHYQLGNLPEALKQYDAALKLFLVNRDWMLRVQFPKTLSASSAPQRARISWGKSTRKSKVGHFPSSMLTFQGPLGGTDVTRTGGVIRPRQFLSVRADEVVRSVTLALRRRLEIMGPTAPHDSLTTQLVAALGRRPGPPNHWSKAWIDVQLGLAHAMAGRKPQAIGELQKSIVAAGQFDHPLTGIALLELGKLALAENKYPVASNYFLEATYAAALFDDFDVMSEAFHLGLVTHLLTGRKGAYPPLAEAAAWAHTRGTPPLEASIWLDTTENYAAFGQAAGASAALGKAQRIMNRREMAAAQLGARLQRQTAQVAYLGGKSAAGDTALTAALKIKRGGSRRLFQIALVDKWYTGGRLAPRVSRMLMSEVLREPTTSDWILDPLETLATLTTPHGPALEHWFFHTLYDQKQPDEALEIADRIRRHRFLTTLPVGGRLLALRWIIEAPKETLDDEALLQRNDLLVKHPALAELSKQVAATRGELAELPLVPSLRDDVERQTKLLDRLTSLSTAQETILRSISVNRTPTQLVFPPLRSLEEIRGGLPKRRLVLSFLVTSRFVFGFAVSKEKEDVQYWRIGEPTKVRENVVAMLKSMGHYDRNNPLSEELLRGASWKEPARKILDLITGDMRGADWDSFDEVVIVPDGLLWYVPFEALQVPGNSGPKALISKVQLRYAPTVSLALPDRRGHLRGGRTAVNVGQLFPRDDEEATAELYEQFASVVPHSARLGDRLPAPSGLFSSICDRLVVLDDVEDRAASPYSWSPMQVDRGKPGSSLGHWFSLPWGGPQQVVLPGFHTPAEVSLRNGGTGDEIFLSLCGMMSTGTRSVLLSRWRTGGRSSYDLTREFVQELPHASAAAAWQRSVQLMMHTEIDPNDEPRVQAKSMEKPLLGRHPFFWSGYLLADTGSAPPRDEPVEKLAEDEDKAKAAGE